MAFTGNYICDTFKTELLKGTLDFSATTADVYKIALYTANATFNESTVAYTSDDEVVAAGYTAGGLVLTSPSVSIADNVAFISFANAVWSGAITARGALVYKVGGLNTALFVLDFGADRTSSSTFTVEFPPATSNSAIVRIS